MDYRLYQTPHAADFVYIIIAWAWFVNKMKGLIFFKQPQKAGDFFFEI